MVPNAEISSIEETNKPFHNFHLQSLRCPEMARNTLITTYKNLSVLASVESGAILFTLRCVITPESGFRSVRQKCELRDLRKKSFISPSLTTTR